MTIIYSSCSSLTHGCPVEIASVEALRFVDAPKPCECVRGTTSGHAGFCGVWLLFPVMAGLVPAIHVVPLRECATQVPILRRIARKQPL
jgi:hypothetical protein